MGAHRKPSRKQKTDAEGEKEPGSGMLGGQNCGPVGNVINLQKLTGTLTESLTTKVGNNDYSGAQEK